MDRLGCKFGVEEIQCRTSIKVVQSEIWTCLDFGALKVYHSQTVRISDNVWNLNHYVWNPNNFVWFLDILVCFSDILVRFSDNWDCKAGMSETQTHLVFKHFWSGSKSQNVKIRTRWNPNMQKIRFWHNSDFRHSLYFILFLKWI